MATVRWSRDIPEPVRSLDTLARVDYADIVTATVSGDAASRAPDEWLGVALRRLPRALLRVVPLIQRFVLGLRLEPRSSPDHPLGWSVAERGDGWLRLEAASWFLTGHIVLHGDDGRLSFATFVRYDRPLARLVWPPVSLIHRRVALVLVRGAVQA